MSARRLSAIIALAALFGAGPARAAAPEVVVSIKPLHSLAAAVMEGAGTPRLLVGGNASPHSYTLRPSDAKALNQAALVAWVGPGLEGFLEKPLASLSGKARIVSMADLPGALRLPPREGGAWEPHPGHDEAEQDHDHGHDHHETNYDAHMWLDIGNAKLFVAALGEELSRIDPDHAALYQNNSRAEQARLDALDGTLTKELSGEKAPFVVFHDAYQYFEHRYGLNAVGSITVGADRQPGAKRIKEIQVRLGEAKARCVFREPQFSPALVKTVTEGSAVRTGMLDPLGADIAEGPAQYFEMMGALSRNLRDCLSKG